MTFVAPSRWLADRVKERFDGRLRAEWIPNGIDLSIFKPIVDKDAVRHALGLPAGKKVILAVAHSFESECKGKAHLVQAAELLSSRWGDALAIVVVGHWREDTRPHSPIWSFRDSIQDEDLLNLYYNAADVLVLPSSAENLPNTLIEAMAAGVPCVAFRVGGCPEIVRQGERVKTGFLARPYDKEDLALGIDRILALSQEQKNEMSLCCRRVVEQDYSIRVQAQRYDDLFGARIASHE
jgi:glycosyltransferase involved in cell wall biosynthesis